MDLLLAFIACYRDHIGLLRFNAYLGAHLILFTIDADLDYPFVLPTGVALDIADAYRQPGQVLDFTHAVSVYGIGAAERVLLAESRRRKLALLGGD